jgi:homoprotocatechuate degradation regulator HpaR
MLPFRNLLRRHNLTEPQFRVLRTVDELANIELTELSRLTALLVPSLSRIVRELEMRGYMEREADPRDMRCTLVRLTPRGRRLVQLLIPDCETIYGQIKRAMGREKLHLLQSLLEELETKLGYLEFQFDDTAPPDDDVVSLAPLKQRGRPPKQPA